MKKALLIVMLISILYGCNSPDPYYKFNDNILENSYWRFYCPDANEYDFDYNKLTNGIVIKFNTSQTVQIFNYSQMLDDNSKWISNKDTLSSFYIDYTGSSMLISRLKKIDKIRYTGLGELYDLVTVTNNSGTSKEKRLRANFNVIGERLTKEEAENFINVKYKRPNEVLSGTTWNITVSTSYNKLSDLYANTGMKDSIVLVEFKWYHCIKLPEYEHSTMSDLDSIRWVKYGFVDNSVNSNTWYQTSDSTAIINVSYNYLNYKHSMRFYATFYKNTMKGICGSLQHDAYFNYKMKYNFSGIKQK